MAGGDRENRARRVLDEGLRTRRGGGGRGRSSSAAADRWRGKRGTEMRRGSAIECVAADPAADPKDPSTRGPDQTTKTTLTTTNGTTTLIDDGRSASEPRANPVCRCSRSDVCTVYTSFVRVDDVVQSNDEICGGTREY